MGLYKFRYEHHDTFVYLSFPPSEIPTYDRADVCVGADTNIIYAIIGPESCIMDLKKNMQLWSMHLSLVICNAAEHNLYLAFDLMVTLNCEPREISCGYRSQEHLQMFWFPLW
jgi:hypothetical protein